MAHILSFRYILHKHLQSELSRKEQILWAFLFLFLLKHNRFSTWF